MTEPTWKDPLLQKLDDQCSEPVRRTFRAMLRHDASALDAFLTLSSLGPNHPYPSTLRSLIDAELARGREAVEVLREVEWSGVRHSCNACPTCNRFENHHLNDDGKHHAPDCRLARLLTSPKP